jgi:tetratricopeptide (TPR) repeat protein
MLRRKILIALSAVFLAVILIVLFLEPSREAYEVVSTRLFPNANVEFKYGERHFNASDPGAYNVGLAEYFFWQAEALDPKIPYLFHEIARIDFLKGNFNKALAEITVQIEGQGDKTPNSYYVRGLIEGYMGDYDAAATDYEYFLKFDPNNWAGLNDYSWVLLKANRPHDAYLATTRGLKVFPDNPWLLNSNAIALYETGDLKDAKVQAQKALDESQKVTAADWLQAYPGNDPKIAQTGIEAFEKATLENMHSIISATSTHALQ